MASVGRLHQLVARNHKLLKAAFEHATHLVRHRASPFTLRFAQGKLSPVFASAHAQPLHPAAALRQRSGASRHYTTSSFRHDKSTFPTSRTRTAVTNLTGRAPFASTLRPNLTGGTLGRTAGGYGLGPGRIGGARYFSHSPSAPAEVIQHVSQAIRAFCLGGNKAQYCGLNALGDKRYKAVSALQHGTVATVEALPRATPGSFVDFHINPTITALTPLSGVAGFNTTQQENLLSLNTDGFLDVLSADFSRALKDLAAVLNDVKQLSDLGDLPITFREPATLRVHFPGCDAGSVERLCAELNVKRGLVSEDPDFAAFAGAEIALLFPFAPSKAASEMTAYSREREQDRIDWQDMQDDQYSTQSEESYELFTPADGEDSGSDFSPEGYESLRSPSNGMDSASASDPLEYCDFNGIYRFIELCDTSRR